MRSKTHTNSKTEDYRELAGDALTYILEPLSSFAIENGLSVEDVYRRLRIAAIRSVSASQTGSSSRTSISGIAASTGIPRAEVSRLLKTPLGSPRSHSVNDQITNVILAAWRQDPKFTDKGGQPAALKLYGRGRTFDGLVTAHGRGIPTRAILEELKRTRSVSIESGQVVRQRAEVAVEIGISSTAILMFAERVTEFLNTLLFNMKNPSNSRLVSRAFSRSIPIDSVPLLRREIKARSQQYLTDVQDLLLQRSVAKRGKGKGASTLGVTTFYFEDIKNSQDAKVRKRTNYRRVKKVP